MRKSYKLENLDCANCAAKMERDITRLEGVTKAKVSFLTQKLTIETEGEISDTLLDQAQKICSLYERECEIVR